MCSRKLSQWDNKNRRTSTNASGLPDVHGLLSMQAYRAKRDITLFTNGQIKPTDNTVELTLPTPGMVMIDRLASVTENIITAPQMSTKCSFAVNLSYVYSFYSQ